MLRCSSLENGFHFQEGVRTPWRSTRTIAAELAARGLRLTRQRRAVVDAVAASNACLSPLDVFQAARADCPELGLTTVYRTLELLGEIGALRRIHGPDGCERLVPATTAHGHSVVCGVCGRVTEFTECDMTAVLAAARRETGYRITEHFLQLNGVCAACAARDRPTRRVALEPCGSGASRRELLPASASCRAGCGGRGRRREPAEVRSTSSRRRPSSPTSPRTSPATASPCAPWSSPTPTCTRTSRRRATSPASPAPTSSSSTAPASSGRSRPRCAGRRRRGVVAASAGLEGPTPRPGGPRGRGERGADARPTPTSGSTRRWSRPTWRTSAMPSADADPAGAATYAANADAYVAELEALDRWIGAQVATIPAESASW